MDITHDFPINVAPARVFGALSDPALLNEWWTLNSSGIAALGNEYELNFGPAYQWRGQVTKCEPGSVFELTMTQADQDWVGTTVGMTLTPRPGGTQVQFAHRGWASESDHFRLSSYCWAMYLRVLKRNLEYGERVPYDRRLEV